jgi:undecaprenyl-diphosphatase
MGLDTFFLRLINRASSNGWFDAWLPWITNGRRNFAILLLVGLGIVLATRRGEPAARRRGLAAVVLAAAAAGLGDLLGSHLLKPLVARPRPPLVLAGVLTRVGVGSHFSFPSSHAVTTTAALATVALAYPRWRWPAMIYCAVIAYSRVYVGAHWPTDVLTGAALGLACAGVLWGAARRRGVVT